MKIKKFTIGGATIKALDGKASGALLVDDWMRRPLLVTPKLRKALPKDKEKPVKKTKTDGKATSKKAGKNGKTRYGYPADKNQKKEGGSSGAKKKPGGDDKKKQSSSNAPAQKTEETGGDPIAVPKDPTPKSVDPQQIANQLQIPVATLQHIAARFTDNKNLGGRSGFVKFMGSRFKEFNEKHKLEGDYFGLLFDALTGATNVASKV